jgi:hypothetical protein
VGVSAAQATEAIQAATAAHLASRRQGLALTLDSLATAIRDDSKFVLVRTDALIVVESEGRFVQLTDGVGTFEPSALQTLEKGPITIDVREGHL